MVAAVVRVLYLPVHLRIILGNPWFIGGGTSFMKVLPFAGWMYVGIESLNSAANDVDEVSQRKSVTQYSN